MKYTIEPIAFVKNSRKEILDDNWGNVISTIELADDIKETAVDGIEEFSHLEIIYYIHKVADEKIQFDSRHPRNNPAFPKVGIFAQRGKNRPNKLGATIVELVEAKGKILTVKGLDTIDGTPVIDIKPVMKEFLPRTEVKQPNWAETIMKNYWN